MSFQKRFQDFFGTWQSLLTLLATFASLLIAMYFGVRQLEKSSEVLIKRIAQESLTRRDAARGLEASYTFSGRKVTDLTLARFSLENSGSAVLVGKGPRSSLIGECLHIAVPNEVSILSAEIIGSALGFQLVSINKSTVCIRFEQWKPAEQVQIQLFVEGLGESKKLLDLSEPSRDLIGGNIRFEQPSGRLSNAYPWITRILPDAVAAVVIAGTTILGGFVILVFVLGFFESMAEITKIRKWRIKDEANFIVNMRTKLGTLSDEEKETCAKRWWTLPSTIGKDVVSAPPSWSQGRFDFKLFAIGLLLFVVHVILFVNFLYPAISS